MIEAFCSSKRSHPQSNNQLLVFPKPSFMVTYESTDVHLSQFKKYPCLLAMYDYPSVTCSSILFLSKSFPLL